MLILPTISYFTVKNLHMLLLVPAFLISEIILFYLLVPTKCDVSYILQSIVIGYFLFFIQ